MMIDEFIAPSSKATGSERANARTFTRELCVALDLPASTQASNDNGAIDYVFERSVVFLHSRGTSTTEFIARYRRGAPIWRHHHQQPAANV